MIRAWRKPVYGLVLSVLFSAFALFYLQRAVYALSPSEIRDKGNQALSLLKKRLEKGCAASSIISKMQKVKKLGGAGKIKEANALLEDILLWFRQTPCKISASRPRNQDWGDDRGVTIRGYSRDAMEPFISRDGQYLFFNDNKTKSKDKDIFWAKRIDDYTFLFMGEVKNVNTSKVDGVPTMDENGNFYFISAKDYGFFNKNTVFTGLFNDGKVSRITSLPELALGKPGWLNMDVEISADGQTLYATQTYFGSGAPPKKSYFFHARKDNGRFTPQKDSDKIFKNINNGYVVYAATISRDETEIYYTRLLPDLRFETLRAVRSDKKSPFASPEVIAAITGFAEAPALSHDEMKLYYHKRSDRTGKFEIRVLHKK